MGFGRGGEGETGEKGAAKDEADAKRLEDNIELWLKNPAGRRESYNGRN